MRTKTYALCLSAIVIAAAVCISAPAAADVVIDVSRDGVVENLSPPQPLADAIYQALLTSTRSSQNVPAEQWYSVFTEPNWIYARFAPAEKIDIDGRTWMLPGNLPHIGIVSDRLASAADDSQHRGRTGRGRHPDRLPDNGTPPIPRSVAL